MSRTRFLGALALVLIGAVLVPSAVRDDEIDTTTRRRATTTTSAPVGVLTDVLADLPAQAAAEPPAGVRRGGGGRRVAAPRSAATGTPARRVTATAPPGGSAPAVPPAPNGRIAYSPGGGEGAEIFTVLPDGTGLRRLTTGHTPRWSPDGSLLAFEDRSPESSLFVVAADGSNRRPLTDHMPAFDAQWSPAGDEIAFLAVRPTGSPNTTYSPLMPVTPGYQGDINVVSVSSGTVRPITAGPDVDFEPAWSPDGTQIAFLRAHSQEDTRNADALYVASSVGGARPLWTPPGRWYLTGTAWTPSRRVAVTAGHGGRGQGVWAVSGDGSARRLALRDEELHEPQWSPSGDAVLVRSLGTGFAAMSVDGRVLFELEATAAAWSHDGAHVAFLAGDKLWRMNRDGTNAFRLVDGVRGPCCSGFPSISWSPPTP